MRPIGAAVAVVAMTFLVLTLFELTLAAAQSSTPPVFTAQQATAGKAAFSKACAACHMPDLSGNNEVPPLAGVSFIGTWGDRPTRELFDYMSGAMPPGGPAQTVEVYESIAAYILQSNGAVAGSDAFKGSINAPIRSLVKKRSIAPEVWRDYSANPCTLICRNHPGCRSVVGASCVAGDV